MTNHQNPHEEYFPAKDDRLVVVPEVTIPASVPAAIAEGQRRLDAIAGELAEVAEMIGTEVGQHMLALSLDEFVGDDQCDSIEGRLGWPKLSDDLVNLGEALLSAAGQGGSLSWPNWSEQLRVEWTRARLAFADPESDEAAMLRNRLAIRADREAIAAELSKVES